MIPTARSVASGVLVRVAVDRAFAAAALDAELGRAVQLDVRDRALATELVYGALRTRPWLEARIARHAPRGVESLDPRVLSELVIAAYQLFFLERVPAFAAVNEAVEAVSRLRGKRVGGFANAVLRKLAHEAKSVTVEDRRAAIFESVPAWMRAALARALGDQGAHEFIASALAPSPIALRARDASAREQWLDRLRTGPGVFEAGKVSPLAIVAQAAGRPRSLAGVESGDLVVQEEGSQLVALALGARSRERVLDACAGRGNKAAILARAVLPGGFVDLADLHPPKLERARSELAREGLAVRATYAVDWTVGTADAKGPYDRILVDAPCSGVGTIRRRPDLELRRTQADVARLAHVQRAIVARVADLLAPGGRLVYAVCSVLREEGPEVAASILASRADLVAAPFDGDAARALAGDDSTLSLLPHVHGTDGYYLASFLKR